MGFIELKMFMLALFTGSSPDITANCETLAALDAALLQTAPAKPTSKRTRGEEAEVLSRKRQREAPAWDATAAKTGGPADRAARAAKTSAAAHVGS